MITGLTMDATYTVQVRQPDGSWQFYSQGEYATAGEARELAGRIYGGQVTTRVIRIERHVEVVD